MPARRVQRPVRPLSRRVIIRGVGKGLCGAIDIDPQTVDVAS